MGVVIPDVSLVDGWLPVLVDALALALATFLTFRLVALGPGQLSSAGPARRVAIVIAGAVGGAVFGLAVCWLVSDYWDLLEVSLSAASRAWIAGAFAILVLAVVAVVRRSAGSRRARRTRRALAASAGIAAIIAATLGVNADFGQYTTIGSLSDQSVAAPLPADIAAAQLAGAPGAGTQSGASALELWKGRAASGLPSRGLMSTITIPATVSHFDARSAYLYLPPAALVPHPVALPVLVMLSGQPGSPSNVVSSGRIGPILDAFARDHHGLAPIVVIPDQLGAPQLNPMCVDGPLGASASYLTIDVPRWIRSHLTVQTSPAAWTIGGFSQGGTCAIQLGAANPALFSSILDISGQSAPQNGDLANTIAVGFGGDAAAYRAASPQVLLERHSPFHATVAVFGVGQLDTRYRPIAYRMLAAARAAQLSATSAVSPGTGHDWRTVRWVLENGMSPIYSHLGLVRPQ